MPSRAHRAATSLLLLLAVLMTVAFAPATNQEVGSDLLLDQGFSVVVDGPRRIPVSLTTQSTMDMTPDGPNAAAVSQSGSSGFVLVDSDSSAVVAAAVPSPLQRFGATAEPFLVGFGSEANGQSLADDLDGSCGVCIVEAGNYDLIAVAANGSRHLEVHVGQAAGPRRVDTEVVDQRSSPWQVFEGGTDTDDRPIPLAGPAVGRREVASLFRCGGCTLPPALVVHDGISNFAPQSRAAGSVNACTGPHPTRIEHCTRHAQTSVMGHVPARWRHVRETEATTDPVGGSVTVDVAGDSPEFRVRLGTLLIPLPHGPRVMDSTTLQWFDNIHPVNHRSS